jgi:hypothetical protein
MIYYFLKGALHMDISILVLSSLFLEHDLEDTKKKYEKEESPQESEDVSGNELTFLATFNNILATYWRSYCCIIWRAYIPRVINKLYYI